MTSRIQPWEGGLDLLVHRDLSITRQQMWTHLLDGEAAADWFLGWHWEDPDEGLLSIDGATFGLIVHCDPETAVLVDIGGVEDEEDMIDFEGALRMGVTLDDETVQLSITQQRRTDLGELGVAGADLEHIADCLVATASGRAAEDQDAGLRERRIREWTARAARVAEDEGW